MIDEKKQKKHWSHYLICQLKVLLRIQQVFELIQYFLLLEISYIKQSVFDTKTGFA